jgi:hypothetical protein
LSLAKIAIVVDVAKQDMVINMFTFWADSNRIKIIKTKRPLVWRLIIEGAVTLLQNDDNGMPILPAGLVFDKTMLMSKRRNDRIFDIYRTYNADTFFFLPIGIDGKILERQNGVYDTVNDAVRACNKYNNDNKKYIKDTNVG